MTSNEATYHRERLGQWASGEDQHIPGKVSGIARMKEASLNKGLCFTIEERQSLGIHGLLPPKVRTEEEQIAHCHHYIDRYDKDINKYLYLMGLLERNEKLFFKVLASDVQKFMPLVYTPTVGLACQQYSNLYTLPRGLFITIYDKGHIYEVLKNWPERDVRAVVVTDGERILGLGDLGINGMGIPVGKLCLYTALAGIKPHQCLPVTLDVGTNTQSILNDPFYMGLRQKRVTGNEYDEFVDEFMKAVVRRFGRNCLIQFEDFGNVNAFRLIEKYKKLYCTFNDDIQGTAAVAVAGIIASLRATKTRLKDNVLVFQGAGEANLGIANLCVMAMVAEGLSEAEARSKIWMVDSKGLIVKNRPEGGISSHKAVFAQNHEPIPTLLEVIKQAKPTILIGAAAIGGAFTREVLEVMGKNNAKPVIFALSNPTHKAECTAEEAYKYTDGKAIFASGSPFAPVTYKDKTYYPGQGNNSYIFPGVALAAICAGMKIIDDDAFLIAARSLARQVTQEDLDKGSLYPPLSTIQECSVKIARDIVEYAYNEGYATVIPEPKDKEAFIRAQMFNPYYGSAIPTIFPYPKV